ncbi:hypothetical protein [Nitrososphaera sp. AFS]|nr:hypothetical protein [Nitrososphaera sp. AFS]
MEIDRTDRNDPSFRKQRKTTKKGIILTVAIVAGIVLASFVVYFIP